MLFRSFRSQSQRLPDARAIGAPRNVTTGRGRRASVRYSAGAIMTSTPKVVARPRANTDTEAMFNFFADFRRDESGSPPSTISAATTQDFTSTPRMDKVKDWLDRSAVEVSQETKEVTSRINAMSMATQASGSDMELCDD